MWFIADENCIWRKIFWKRDRLTGILPHTPCGSSFWKSSFWITEVSLDTVQLLWYAALLPCWWNYDVFLMQIIQGWRGFCTLQGLNYRTYITVCKKWWPMLQNILQLVMIGFCYACHDSVALMFGSWLSVVFIPHDISWHNTCASFFTVRMIKNRYVAHNLFICRKKISIKMKPRWEKNCSRYRIRT